ncbi:MAG: hypothetical protein M3372_06015, partial [Verrucomicrobiota bacterium]|nr:hypothetical protein [Verrucomicrobiota bacterium]
YTPNLFGAERRERDVFAIQLAVPDGIRIDEQHSSSACQLQPVQDAMRGEHKHARVRHSR